MGLNLLPPLFEVVPPEVMPLVVMDIASRIRAEAIYPEKTYKLTNKYLGQYIGAPGTYDCYLYACLLEGENVECLFSINAPEAITPPVKWGVELTRLSAREVKVYFDDKLLVTFPIYSHQSGIAKPGYYIFHVTP